MNNEYYSEKEFDELRERINKELLRRASYSWNGPLSAPKIGKDRTPPLALNNDGYNISVTDKTYTINNPSVGSIVETRNIIYPANGDNPAGDVNDYSSASQFNLDEIRNYLVGLANIRDINLFYGRDEIEHLGFRDGNNIEEVLIDAENDKLNELVDDAHRRKLDPNGGIQDREDTIYPNYMGVSYSKEDDIYVMKSGEYDGEELPPEGLSEEYFFDDYGAKPGEKYYHAYGKGETELVRRDWYDQNNNRKEIHKIRYEGGVSRAKFGMTPRNPDNGDQYRSRPAYIGSSSSCNNACTGLCSITCDNECSESCTSSCWNRCGNACASNCGNVCTGCTVHCYSSCKTKCENNVGHACVNSGAQSFKVTKVGGENGVPAQNKVETKYHQCTGCSYSCQFYPNKKTECWDAGCMGKCYTSCDISCSSSCFGGCIDNKPEDGKNYFTGKGRGCSSACTVNCIGDCTSSCAGYCITECWNACKQQCLDNCSYVCQTNCGQGCKNTCVTGNTSRPRLCGNNCVATCRNDCNGNCVGAGCRSVCGTESHGACDYNCRINCMMSSCTSQCKDACSSECSSCVNGCDLNCGMCTSQCSIGCSAECNITCTSHCESDCSFNCTNSCTETCGGCSNLCYSCTGMCIGRCSVKCTDTCSNCANLCTFWCDSRCNNECMTNCYSYCINTCDGSCIGYLTSETKSDLKGPDRPPTSPEYKYQRPKNREEERDSFIIMNSIAPPKKDKVDITDIYKVIIVFNEDDLIISSPLNITYKTRWSTIHSGVFSINSTTGEYEVNENMLQSLPPFAEGNFDNEDAMLLIEIDGDEINKDDVYIDLPFGFGSNIVNKENGVYVIVSLDPFYLSVKNK